MPYALLYPIITAALLVAGTIIIERTDSKNDNESETR